MLQILFSRGFSTELLSLVLTTVNPPMARILLLPQNSLGIPCALHIPWRSLQRAIHPPHKPSPPLPPHPGQHPAGATDTPWVLDSHLPAVLTGSSRLEKTSNIIQSNYQPCTTTVIPKPHHPAPDTDASMKTLRDGNSTTSPGKLFQCLTTRTVK